MSLELYKYIAGKSIDLQRNAFVNMAINLIQLSETKKPNKVVSRTEKNIPDPINHPGQ